MDSARWGYWLLMLLMLLDAVLPMLDTMLGSGDTTALLLPEFRLLLEVVAISALNAILSTRVACDFLSVFFTKPVMITLQRISTSSRR
jgi:hypothetical protein